ncbi:hypothetical protein M422DRAFT_260259 [Sphaerobolus stellatus SS14]|uniref:DUF6533 domain-containing protein n=1 Tax=Sphaerobolus stellatus (strain SS14) TaxID=990650 RepID=A0A0C9VJ15_SPHS4|nr:hypothetical protein M422DRAFT_260259 [Sphaerobolus stellatus SS14]
MPSILRLPLSELQVGARDTADGQIEKYLPPAALALILYDTFLSADDEFTYVWSQKFGFTTVILVTIDSVMTILFETGGVVLIFIYTWRVYRFWKTTNVRQDCGLSGLLINQGFLRFLFYFVENVVIIILSEVKAEWAKVLSYSINDIAGVVLPLIMCRFILQLRKAATNNIGESHLSVRPESVSEPAGFKAAIRNLGRNIERDFGGDTVTRSLSGSLEDD